MTFFAETDVPTIDPRVEFWSGAGTLWPRSWHRHLFAGNVVHRTGRLLYGRNWDGTEPETILIQPLPARLDAATRPDELAWAIQILARCYPPYAEKLKLAAGEGRAPPLPEPDEWQFAVGVSRQISNDTYAALDRYRQVIDLLVSLLERGILRAALRPFDFGDPAPLPPGTWYNEVYFAWFATCRVDTTNPCSGRPVRGCGHWIVFETEAFIEWEAHVTRIKAQNSEAAPQAVAEPTCTKEQEPEPAAPTEEHTEPSASEAATSDVPDSGTQNGPNDAELSESDQARCEPVSLAGQRRGAKEKYPWHDGPFEEKVVALLTGKPRPRSMHKLASLMQEWCSIEWSNEPGLSQMRVRLAEILIRRKLEFSK